MRQLSVTRVVHDPVVADDAARPLPCRTYSTWTRIACGVLTVIVNHSTMFLGKSRHVTRNFR